MKTRVVSLGKIVIVEFKTGFLSIHYDNFFEDKSFRGHLSYNINRVSNENLRFDVNIYVIRKSFDDFIEMISKI